MQGERERSFALELIESGFERSASEGDALDVSGLLEAGEAGIVDGVKSKAESAGVFGAHGDKYTTKLTLSSKSACVLRYHR